MIYMSVPQCPWEMEWEPTRFVNDDVTTCPAGWYRGFKGKPAQHIPVDTREGWLQEAIRSARAEERTNCELHQSKAIADAVKQEREACARICESRAEAFEKHAPREPELAKVARINASNIRSRGDPRFCDQGKSKP